MRTLYYVPMVHTPQELGILKGAIIAERIKKFGRRQTEEFFKQVEWYWREVEKRIQRTELCQPEKAAHLHIFVDGLPNAKEEIVQKIIQELIALDIPAYRIIEKLQAKGAKVHGTEDPELLLQEHQYWSDVAKGRQPDSTIARELLKSRDQAIAQRIDAKVPEGEIGFLFLGKVHNVVEELIKLSQSQKFKIVYL